MADWWYAKNGERLGPVSSSQLRQLAKSGELQPTDMVFKEGASQWIVASSVNNLFRSGGTGIESVRTERVARDERDVSGDDFDDRDDYDKTIHSGASGSSSVFMNFLLFRKTVAPTLTIVMFWLGVAGVICFGIFSIITPLYYLGSAGLIPALIALVLIPFELVGLRIVAEVTILLFRIYDVLVEIRQGINKQSHLKN